MTKDKNNNTEKTSRKRPPKIRHIDVRFTEEEYNLVVHNARLSGRSKSTYLHDLGIGHKPSLPMTAEQEEALKGLIGARSELVYVRNALHALPQAERLKLFKRELSACCDRLLNLSCLVLIRLIRQGNDLA